MRSAAFTVVLLVACGGRTPLGVRGDGGAADASHTEDASVTPSCTWSIGGAPARVSAEPKDVPGDVGLADAIASANGALVTWITPGDHMHAQTAVARLVGFDLVSNGDEHVAMRAASVVAPLYGVSLANGFGHAAIAGFDGDACILHPVTLDGASNGGTTAVSRRACAGTTATPSGFDVLLSSGRGGPPQLFVQPVDPSGLASAQDTLLVEGTDEVVQSAARATFADRSYLIAAILERPTNGARVVARHFDAQAVPLAPLRVLAERGDLVSTKLAIAPTGIAPALPGALLAWVAFNGHDGHVEVVPLDLNGEPRSAPRTVASSAVSVTSIALTRDTTGGALLAWSEYGPNPSSANVLALTASGAPRGDVLGVPDPVSGAKYAPAIEVVATGSRGLVLFEARSETTPHRVYAAPLTCTP